MRSFRGIVSTLALGLAAITFGGVAPTLSSANYTLGDPLGGGDNAIVLTGVGFTGATAVDFGGSSAAFTVDSDTQITATLPAHAAGVVNITVTGPGGPSNTVSFEYWSPLQDAATTFLAEAPDYDGATGTWTVRYSAPGANNPTPKFAGTPTATGGAPVFPGDGTKSGLSAAAHPWSDYLDSVTSGGAYCYGSIAAVFSSNNAVNHARDDSNHAAPYNQPCVWGSMVSAVLGIGFCWDGGATPAVSAHAYDGSFGYRPNYIAAPVNDRHAVVARFDATSHDTSLNGGLSGSNKYVTSTMAVGIPIGYLNTTNELDVGFMYNATSAVYQKFEGSPRALIAMNAKCSDTFITKFYAWSQQRHSAASTGGNLSSPQITAADQTLFDPLGGDTLVLTGVRFTGVTGASGVTVGGVNATSYTVDSDTQITLVVPAHASAASVGVVVTHPTNGASNTWNVEYWKPEDDPALTFLAEAGGYAVAGATGTWTVRYDATGLGANLVNKFADPPDAYEGCPALWGLGVGATKSGLYNGTRVWADFLGPNTGYATSRAGTLFSGAASGNDDNRGPAGRDTLTPAAPYNNPILLGDIESSAGVLGLGHGVDASLNPLLQGHVYESGVGYHALTVPRPSRTHHLGLLRWQDGLASPVDLSVDGALSGTGFATLNKDGGIPDIYTVSPCFVDVAFAYNAGSDNYQLWEGVPRFLGVMNAYASDTFVTKLAAWAKSRHKRGQYEPACSRPKGWYRESFAALPWKPEGSTDRSGVNGNFGTSAFAPTSGFALNGYNCLIFNGVDQYVQSDSDSQVFFNDTSSATQTNWAINVLAYIDSVAAPTVNPYDEPAIVSHSGGGYFGITANTSGVRCFAYDGAYHELTLDWASIGLAGGTFAPGWYHITFRGDGTHLYLNVNGHEHATPPTFGNIQLPSGYKVQLGRNYSGAVHFTGKIREFKSFGYCPTTTQIDQERGAINSRYKIAL